MELKCYEIEPGHVRVEPARLKRDWMDETPDGHAYRCLPLTRANSHGWELLCPLGFEAVWNGEPGIDAIGISVDSREENDAAESQNQADPSGASATDEDARGELIQSVLEAMKQSTSSSESIAVETFDEATSASSHQNLVDHLLKTYADSAPTSNQQEGNAMDPAVSEEGQPSTLQSRMTAMIKKNELKIREALGNMNLSRNASSAHMIESHFGNGILTFNPLLIFQTEPGYDLWISGPSNQFKDGIQATQAIVETDWMPFTFSVNWKFTRPNVPIRFEKGEPFCFLFPIQRGAVESCEPVITSLESDPDLKEVYWSTRVKRNMASMLSKDPQERFQGWYMRGNDPISGDPGTTTHQLATRSRKFTREAS